MQLVIKREFQDIVGETNLADTRPLRLRVEAVAGVFLDSFDEPFVTGRYEDTQAIFVEPRAEWSSDENTLQPATPFEGTNMEFDWIVTT